jgi:hypothetical protein
MSSPPLTRPIKPINRTLALYTIDEACAYLISLPRHIAGMGAWESAADLALKPGKNQVTPPLTISRANWSWLCSSLIGSI